MNIQSEEKVWQRELLKERKEEGEDTTGMRNLKKVSRARFGETVKALTRYGDKGMCEGVRMETEEGEVAYGLAPDKKEIKSEVENTLTTDCCFNSLSLDQRGQSSFNANAVKSMSSGSGIANASFINEEYSSNGINSTINKTFVSTTKSIYTSPFFFSCSNLPFLDALCNLTDQSIISCSFSNSFNISSIRSNLSIFCSIAFSTKPDQLISRNLFIFFSTSAGIPTFNSPISITYNNINPEYIKHLLSKNFFASQSRALPASTQALKGLTLLKIRLRSFASQKPLQNFWKKFYQKRFAERTCAKKGNLLTLTSCEDARYKMQDASQTCIQHPVSGTRKKEKIRPFRGSNPGVAMGKIRESPIKIGNR